MSKPLSEKQLRTLKPHALRLIAQRESEKVKDLVVVHAAREVVPSSKSNIFQFIVTKRDDPNGPHYTVVIDEKREVVDLAELAEREGVEFFAEPTLEVGPEEKLAEWPDADASITPPTNDLILELSESVEETVTVRLTGIDKFDVYFLADTTGSMTSAINAVKTGSTIILNELKDLEADIAFGVGNYRDLPHTDPPFQHQLNPTGDADAVKNAIDSWTAGGGGDGSEAQLYALDSLAQAPGGDVGWRPNAKRIIVWFGDYPGHDPICKKISNLDHDVTEASVTTKLVAQTIAVLAISTPPGPPDLLDDDPKASARDYEGTCPIGGTRGQATRITTATGGEYRSGTDPAELVATTLEVLNSAFWRINKLKLVAGGPTAQFVDAISPAGGYGPLTVKKEQVLPFKVRFTGTVPCDEKDRVFKGVIRAVADGVVVAKKRVRVTVPQCGDMYSYSVKFVCGVEDGDGGEETSVRPGVYATEINIHNYHDVPVRLKKYVLPLVLRKDRIYREPEFTRRKGRDYIVLPPNTATLDDCHRISEILYDRPLRAPMPLMIGILEIVSNEELSVTAVYTATGLKGARPVSIEVRNVEGKLKKRPEEVES
ncbi:MAG: VWA domain-containing protein [bacterium]|nr:VWA domain-containing protein [bacterium]